MSNEEAIKTLRSKMDGSVDTSYEWAECVRLAIQALLEQESKKGMTIDELIERFYDSGTFILRLFTIHAEHIGDFKSDSIGLKEYMNHKIKLWSFGANERILILYLKEENEECK